MTVYPHATARDLYAAYLARVAALARARAHAQAVVKATSGATRTPVRPLATMGPGGGPLLCDVCRKPMVLEGGAYNKMDADAAWAANPDDAWVSYILGGMTLLVESNGTLRVYHGYTDRSGCALGAERDERCRRDLHRSRFDRATADACLGMVSAYLRAELPERDNDAHLNEFYRAMLAYDPGLGVNAPTEEST